MSDSLIEVLRTLFKRDLLKLKQEIDSYTDETVLWQVEKSISNSAGNLCLHLVGNLNAFVGAVVGNTGYIRQREREFGDKNVPKAELLKMVDQTILVVDESLQQLTPDQFNGEFPIKVFAEKTSMEYMLVHLTTHLAYHLGQVNYHRRLLDE